MMRYNLERIILKMTRLMRNLPLREMMRYNLELDPVDLGGLPMPVFH